MALHRHPTSYGNPVVGGDMNDIFIGKYCSIADSAMFDGGIQHNTRFVTTYPLWRIEGPENREGMCRGDIHVGNDVWIGDGALIMSGVTIGDGAVVAARSVVTRNVSPYAIVGGGKARFLKWRFSEDKIFRLLALKWWDWSEEKIKENGPLMLSENIEAFLAAHEGKA